MKPSDAIDEQIRHAEDLKFDGKHEEAIVLLEQLLAEKPDCVPALEEIADNEMSLGRMERATRAALNAKALDPKSVAAHYVLGFIASHEARWKESIEWLRTANELEPNDAEILRCLGWSLYSGGQDVEGLVTLERALNLDPENPLILSDLGVVYLRTQDVRKAISLFERALAIDPDNERAAECLMMATHVLQHMPSLPSQSA